MSPFVACGLVALIALAGLILILSTKLAPGPKRGPIEL